MATRTETDPIKNMILLDYMGTKPKMSGPDSYYYMDGIFYSISEDTPEKVMIGLSQYAKYSTSWDWLMPVVGKISTECENPDELDPLKHALLCNDIDTAYDFVVDYLTDLKS